MDSNIEQAVKEQYKDELAQIPESYHDIFLDMVGVHGKSPNGIVACVEYIRNDVSMREAAEKHNISTQTVQATYGEVLERGSDDVVCGSRARFNADLISDIGSILGWTEGVEYSRNGNLATINKDGYRSILNNLEQDRD